MPVCGQTDAAADDMTLSIQPVPEQARLPCNRHPALQLPGADRTRDGWHFLCPCCAQETRQRTYAAQRAATLPASPATSPAPATDLAGLIPALASV
jgi:hypothetical protein